MKAILFPFILLFVFCFEFQAKESLPENYSVDSIVFRSQLKEGEAVYHFKFNNLPGMILRGGKHVPTSTHTIIYAYDGANQTATLGSDNILEIKLKPGNHRFQFYLNDWYEEISTFDIECRSRHKTFVSCYMQPAEQRVICEKPVIYLYPEQEMDVQVKLQPKGSFTFIYPAYNEGWNVKAKPGGELIQGDNSYNYLFWESDQYWKPAMTIFQEGSIVQKGNVTSFLEASLDAFGLNSKEKADFITYWAPQLIRHDACFIHFMVNEEANEFAELNITPEPDHVYRIYMITYPAKDLENTISVPQQIQKIDRSGFTVVEWGGTIIQTDKNLEEEL